MKGTILIFSGVSILVLALIVAGLAAAGTAPQNTTPVSGGPVAGDTGTARSDTPDGVDNVAAGNNLFAFDLVIYCNQRARCPHALKSTTYRILVGTRAISKD